MSARFAAGEHDMQSAARYYSQSLKNDPGNASLLALAFFYSTTSGDVEGAGKYAAQVLAGNPDDRAARLAMTVIAFKHHDYAEARKQLGLSAKGPSPRSPCRCSTAGRRQDWAMPRPRRRT